MVRQIRLISGLFLFAFVVSHLLNHTLGLVSLASLEQGRAIFAAIWDNPPAHILLAAALLIHLLLAAWALYLRRELKMPVSEAVQLALGFAIPFLLLNHMMGTVLAKEQRD